MCNQLFDLIDRAFNLLYIFTPRLRQIGPSAAGAVDQRGNGFNELVGFDSFLNEIIGDRDKNKSIFQISRSQRYNGRVDLLFD